MPASSSRGPSVGAWPDDAPRVRQCASYKLRLAGVLQPVPPTEAVMNAVELLKKQHREVDALFKRFEKAKRDAEKETIFLEVAARLVAHDAIEREIFYPACERALGKVDPLMEGIAEHGLVEFSVYRADKGRGRDGFEYLVTSLKEMVEHHVEEEEKELLPKVQKTLSDAALEKLGAAMLARFEEGMATDFRKPLRQNLEQVLLGKNKTTPPKRPARTKSPKRATRSRTRPTGQATKASART